MKRNTLTAAILAGVTGVAGMVSVSHAVNLNPDGLGQVLLYPYYTARGGNDTLISVVNTTTEAKAVKVRFIEALNSREVLDFNLYLSPFDVWTATVTLAGNGEGGTMVTRDTSCTVPYFVGEGLGGPGVGVQDFLTFQYSFNNFDGGPQGLERTASGYLEIIEMGSIPQSSPFFTPIKHVNGVPGSCATVTAAWADGGIWTQNSSSGLEGPTGGLFGTGSILNADEGTLFSYDATALQNFWLQGQISHTNPGDLFPNLDQSLNFTSNTFDNGVVRTDSWDFSVQAVDATIMFDKLMNEYNVNPLIGTRSEWVVTFPTKAFHVDNNVGSVGAGSGAPLEPFTDTWSVPLGGDACEEIDIDLWDREERTPAPGGLVVSPRPPGSPEFRLCREVNIIRFAANNDNSIPQESEIFKEMLRPDPTLTYSNFGLPAGFNGGWAQFNFGTIPGGGERLATSQSQTPYFGLPVIGFWAQRFTNGFVPTDGGQDVIANYAGSYDHKGSRRFAFSSISGN